MDDDKLKQFDVDSTSCSMRLVYKHISRTVELQLQTGEHLDSKSRTLFAIASAVVAFAVPLVLAQLGTNSTLPFRGVLVGLAVVPLGFYALAAVFFWCAFGLRSYSRADDPETVAKYTKLTEGEAYERLFNLIGNSYIANGKVNKTKADWVRRLTYAVFALTGTAIVHALLVAIVSVGR